VSQLLRLEWSDVDIACRQISSILGATPPDLLVAISRGGLIPATILSHRIGDVPVISITARVTESDAANARKLDRVVVGELPKELHAPAAGSRQVLVVDDVYGSGATLRAVVDVLRTFQPLWHVSTACLVRNLANAIPGVLSPDYVGKVVNGWVVFPWE
jgi:hypoxanthine phosphoribosyltransferase